MTSPNASFPAPALRGKPAALQHRGGSTGPLAQTRGGVRDERAHNGRRRVGWDCSRMGLRHVVHAHLTVLRAITSGGPVSSQSSSGPSSSGYSPASDNCSASLAF